MFGEGEYGVTDILYAAARSNNCEVFRVLLDSAMLPRGSGGGGGGGGEGLLEDGDVDESSGGVFGRDMMNRAVHAAARGGNWEILKELLGNGSGVLGYGDAQGCTVLHTAAGRGQVEVRHFCFNVLVNYLGKFLDPTKKNAVFCTFFFFFFFFGFSLLLTQGTVGY